MELRWTVLCGRDVSYCTSVYTGTIVSLHLPSKQIDVVILLVQIVFLGTGTYSP